MAVGTTAAVLGGAALGGLLGGSKQSGSSTTTQVNNPWAPIQPYILNVAQQGQNLYNRGPFNFAANQSPFTTQAQNLTAQRALDPNSLIGRSQGQIADTISGKYLDPNTNPSFASAVSDALGQAGSAFASQYGGAAGQNLDNSGYREQLARNLGQIATNAYSNAYQQERQNQLNATQMAPSLDYANLSQLANVGAQQDALKYQQYYQPFQDLSAYQSALSPGLNFGTAATTSPYFTNPFSNVLGGALGGAALSRLAGPGSLFGPTAAAGGTDLTALAALLP